MSDQPMDLIFHAESLTLRFGGVVSLRDVSLDMRRGEILAVIGPNGAGKTSLFNSLTGVYQPQEGSITFFARDAAPLSVIGKKAHQIAQAGVSRTFQASRLFSALSVFENIKIGAEDHRGVGLVGALVKGPGTRRGERTSDDVVLDLLDFVGLSAEANLIASQLSYGARRRLEIARALATKPEVILLDEPAAGTNPSEKLSWLRSLICRVRDEREVSVLLIEHDMKLVMSLAERLYVLNFGSVIAEGTPEAIRANQAVIDAYLGTTHEREERLSARRSRTRSCATDRPEALHGVSFNVEQGEIVTLLGANGAGKSTTLRMISGLHPPSSGSITYEGRDITKIKAHELVDMGKSATSRKGTTRRLSHHDGRREPRDGRVSSQGPLG